MNRILDNELLSNLDENEENKNGEEAVYRTITPKCEIDIGEDSASAMQRNKRVIVPLNFNIHEDLSAQFSDQAMREFLLF